MLLGVSSSNNQGRPLTLSYIYAYTYTHAAMDISPSKPICIYLCNFSSEQPLLCSNQTHLHSLIYIYKYIHIQPWMLYSKQIHLFMYIYVYMYTLQHLPSQAFHLYIYIYIFNVIYSVSKVVS